MNDVRVGRRLLSGSVLRVSNLAIAAVSSLFLLPFIVHHLGDRVYGFWSLAIALIGYYGLLDFGVSSAVSQYVCTAIGRNDPAECRAVFNAALRIQCAIGGVALLATLVLAAASHWFCKNPGDAQLLWKIIVILGVASSLGFPAKAYGGVLDAQLRFDIQSWLSILGILLRTGLTVWVVLRGWQLLALAWATLLATLPVSALQFWFARWEAPWARIGGVLLPARKVKELFSYSVYTFLAMMADVLRFQLDPLVISAFIGLVAVTHYRVASAFSSYYVNFVIAAIGTFGPVMSRLHGAADRRGLERTFLFATKLSMLISVFLCLALVAWGKPFIARWMGAKYEDAYWPLVVLTVAVFLDVSQTASISLLYSTLKHRFYTYINFAEGIINLGVSLVLVHRYGILGVALGTLMAAFLVRVVAQPIWVCRVADIRYLEYVRFTGVTFLRCTALMTGCVALAMWGLKPNYGLLLGSAACSTIIYAIGSWWGVFTQKEREQLTSTIRFRDKSPREVTAAVAVAQ